MPIDRQNYPPDWELRSRFIRFYRARNRCELCGCKSHHALQTMHLNHDTRDNRLLNLAAVCPLCHNNYDLEKRLQTRTGRKKNIRTIPIDDVLTAKRKRIHFHLFRKRRRNLGQLKLFKTPSP